MIDFYISSKLISYGHIKTIVELKKILKLLLTSITLSWTLSVKAALNQISVTKSVTSTAGAVVKADINAMRVSLKCLMEKWSKNENTLNPIILLTPCDIVIRLYGWLEKLRKLEIIEMYANIMPIFHRFESISKMFRPFLIREHIPNSTAYVVIDTWWDDKLKKQISFQNYYWNV